MMGNFLGMTDKQLAVFEQIAVNNDAAHNQRVLDNLTRLGHIDRYRQKIGDSFRVFRYRVPVPIHAQWCEWCESATK